VSTPAPPGSTGSAARRPLLVVGAGGFGRETVEAIVALEARGPTWDLLGFLDDSPTLVGGSVDGVAVVGPIAAVTAHPEAAVVVTTGRPDNYFSRCRLVRRLGLPRARYATVVHPDTSLASSTVLGPGTVVLAGVVTTTSVTIGAHVAVMPGVVLTHDDRVGDFATLTSGARLAGGVIVGEGAYLGAGCLIREGVSIGAWSMVGMGAVVVRDVGPGEVWAGVPATLRRRVEIPEDFLRPAATSAPEWARR